MGDKSPEKRNATPDLRFEFTVISAMGTDTKDVKAIHEYLMDK